ncbi:MULTISPECIES: hypothetical protein [unclassified Paenibacillus]|uniref:Lipoprotein n=1 Tax=Paenibacillus provencensis TaxID=441151 RepID=A0ABW3PNT2_9BACL|nr:MULTISPECIES: hypothetical protein [unclassified Paenibacillus]MCM3126335.1 hypothetical protein [Paenibacillus sp. MER 78]SFS60835.1 hypothetical protein SAMN04488601_1012509 [Paenibacillus sp. 453mf]
MRGLRLRTILISILSLSLFHISGCGVFNNPLDPEETFHRALAGLAGKEEMTFEGHAGLRTSDQGEFTEHFEYKGTLSNHNKLVVSSQEYDPFEPSSNNKAETDSHPVNMERKAGMWRISERMEDSSYGSLTRLNPVEQLEKIGYMKGKTFSSESGTPRGTHMIRIELEKVEASKWVADQLKKEMQILHDELPELVNQVDNSKRQQCMKELERIWNEENDGLNERVKNIEVKSVYHLTVNKKSSLPIRLSAENEVSYKDNREKKEMLITDIYFSKYH